MFKHLRQTAGRLIYVTRHHIWTTWQHVMEGRIFLLFYGGSRVKLTRIVWKTFTLFSLHQHWKKYLLSSCSLHWLVSYRDCLLWNSWCPVGCRAPVCHCESSENQNSQQSNSNLLSHYLQLIVADNYLKVHHYSIFYHLKYLNLT